MCYYLIEVINIDNKIIKCENNFVLSLARNYGANELKTLSAVLYKMTSLISINNKSETENITGIIEEDGTITVEVKFDFFKEILYKSNVTFSEIEEICVNILNIKFEYYSNNGTQKLWNCIPIFKKISKNDENRILYFKLNESFNQFLIGLEKDFTLYELNEFKDLSRIHAQRLYIIGRRYVNLNDGKLRVKLSTFKEWFGVVGKYDRFFDLKKKLNATVKLIEKNTQLKIQWHEEKEGRNIKYLNFVFKYEKELYIKNKGGY